jgi:hypothetical protein
MKQAGLIAIAMFLLVGCGVSDEELASAETTHESEAAQQPESGNEVVAMACGEGNYAGTGTCNFKCLSNGTCTLPGGGQMPRYSCPKMRFNRYTSSKGDFYQSLGVSSTENICSVSNPSNCPSFCN